MLGAGCFAHRTGSMQAIKIKWKSEAKDLTKLYPRKAEDDDPEDIIDAGSFFNFFQYPDDPDNVSSVV